MSNDAAIQSVLSEDRVFPPAEAFTSQATLAGPDALAPLYAAAAADHEGFWADLARTRLTWERAFSEVLDERERPRFRWFADGTLNVSVNCLDRHLADAGERLAIVFEGEEGDIRRLTYRDLHAEVCRFANALRGLGVQKGDRVIIYMPMVPEAVVAMQACARIGAIHSVVFGGFSSEAVKDRVEDAGATVILTGDGARRGGKIVPLKEAVDEALSHGCASIQHVVVLERTAHGVPMVAGRDVWWHDLVAEQPAECEPEWVDAEHPLFLLYTSGSTGKPKGIQHSSAGYLLGTMVTLEWVFDLKPERDVFWCTADVGWITGHSYVAYGPLAHGATIVMYEGAPTYPHAGRLWEIVERHGVTIFYTAPTAIRALMKLGPEHPEAHDLSSIRLLGTVGECINPEAWMWYHHVIGKGRCPIVDTWWQTETGSIMIAPVPGVVPTKPGSCTKPLPGVAADVVDAHGDAVTEPDKGGFLVIKKPWPSMARTIWGDAGRFYDTYWKRYDGRFYLAGDSARRDADGYFWIMGRIDDVINVAGHRLGTMEVESALVAHEKVVEAAVVGRPDDIKGEAIFAFVVPAGARPTGSDAEALAKELTAWVSHQIGPIAKPSEIRFSDNLPKTRSGKIMRRLLKAIAAGHAIDQDTSTLENEAILTQLQGKHE